MTDPFSRNPFRVLGLPGEATWAEITRAAERLKGLESWGRFSTPWDLAWLPPVRREPAAIDAALERLGDPVLRLQDRLFWLHERDAEAAVAYLTAATLRDALEGWSMTTLPVTRHDSAVVALLAATALDAGAEDAALWRRMLAEWNTALAHDDYWAAVVQAESGGGFPQPATRDHLRGLRESGLRLVHEVLVALSRAAMDDERTAEATRLLHILADELPPERFDELCGDVAGPLDVTPPPAVGEPAASPPDAAPEAPEAAPEPPPEPEHRDGDLLELLDHDAPGPATTLPTGGPTALFPPEEPAEPPVRRAAMVAHLSRLRNPGSAVDVEPDEPPEADIPSSAGLLLDDESPAPRRRGPSPPASAPSGRPLPRRRLPALAAAAVVAGLLLVGGPRLLDSARRPPPADLIVTNRLASSDDAVARLLVEWSENDRERLFLLRAMRDYRELADDYSWRLSQGLPYDRAGHQRVLRLYDATNARHQAAVARERVLADTYDGLIRQHKDAVAEVNDRIRRGPASLEQAAAPR